MAGDAVAMSWDSEYRRGRYADESPVAFVSEIVSCASRFGLVGKRGLYIGCGNGRNYVPLVEAGLDLVGLDVSAEALGQLAARRPDRAPDLVLGDLSALPPPAVFSLVIGIQVFQHGLRADAHAHIRAAAARVLPRGLFCLRVNAVATDVFYGHRIVERDASGGFTLVYEEGPKAGLPVHFFAEQELSGLLEPLHPVLQLRADSAPRTSPQTGRWVQWEGIWRRSG